MNRTASKLMPYLFVVVSTVVIVRSLILAFHYPGDVPEFYCASSLLLSGNSVLIYNIEQLSRLEATTFPLLNGRTVGFFLPPPVLIFIWPLAFVPLQLVQPVWFGLCAVALCACFVQMKRLFNLTRVQLLYSWSVIITFGATYECLRLGQLGLFLLLAAITAMCFLKDKREGLAALCLSVFVIKPQLFIPQVIFLFACGRRRLCFLTALLSLVWILGSLAVVGIDCWSAYCNLVGRLGEVSEFAFDNACTICGQLLRMPGLDSRVAIAISSCIWLGAMVLLYRVGRAYRHREDWLNASILAVMPAATVTSLYLMDYDLVLLIPAFVLFVTQKLYGKLSPYITLPAVVSCVMLLLPFHFWLRYDYLLKGAVFNPFVLSLTVIAAVMLSTVSRVDAGGLCSEGYPPK